MEKITFRLAVRRNIPSGRCMSSQHKLPQGEVEKQFLASLKITVIALWEGTTLPRRSQKQGSLIWFWPYYTPPAGFANTMAGSRPIFLKSLQVRYPSVEKVGSMGRMSCCLPCAAQGCWLYTRTMIGVVGKARN